MTILRKHISLKKLYLASRAEPGAALPSRSWARMERPGARAACASSDSRRENWKRPPLYSSCVSVSCGAGRAGRLAFSTGSTSDQYPCTGRMMPAQLDALKSGKQSHTVRLQADCAQLQTPDACHLR